MTMTKRKIGKIAMARMRRFMPKGLPRWIRIYDNGGETVDRYTVLFVGRYEGNTQYVVMSPNPFHPQGVGLHGEMERPSDTNTFGYAPHYGRKCYLGTRIKFEQLPDDCKRLVLDDYIELWALPKKETWKYYEYYQDKAKPPRVRVRTPVVKTFEEKAWNRVLNNMALLIGLTPTGDKRNRLCDINIELMQLQEDMSGKDKEGPKEQVGS